MSESSTTPNLQGIDDNADCLTIISPVAHATIFEFHRRRLAKEGYILNSKVLQHKFEIVDEEAVVSELFDGQSYYAATYVKA